MAISDLADWWDEQRRESEETLERFVQDNPQWWAIGLATATSTAMTLGGGMVDALRLGQGVAKGSAGGVAEDALRLLVVVGPLARGAGFLSRLAHTNSIKLAVQTRGVTGPCTFTAVNNALSIVSGRGRSLFLTARQAAAALGKRLRDVSKSGSSYKLAAWIDDLVPFLRSQGVRIRNLGQPRTLDEVVEAAKRNDGVVIFAIRWIDTTGKAHFHSMIAVRDAFGAVRFADYGGKLLKSLSELASRGAKWTAQGGRYDVHTSGSRGGAVVVEGLELTGLLEDAMSVFRGGMLLVEGVQAVETLEDGVDLAFPVAPAAAPVPEAAENPELIARAFEAYKEREKGRKVLRLEPIVIHARRGGPPRSDYLTGVQHRLNAAGYGAGPVDGIMGPKTLRAVRAFQRHHELDVDGIPGPITQAKLVEICGY